MAEDTVHVLLVFLCLRGLSKSKQLAKQLKLSERSAPGEVLQEVLDQSMAPSVGHLSKEKHDLLMSIITINEKFNLPQFLQGENLPCHIKALEECIQQEGEKPLKCYLFALVT